MDIEDKAALAFILAGFMAGLAIGMFAGNLQGYAEAQKEAIKSPRYFFHRIAKDQRDLIDQLDEKKSSGIEIQ